MERAHVRSSPTADLKFQRFIVVIWIDGQLIFPPQRLMRRIDFRCRDNVVIVIALLLFHICPQRLRRRGGRLGNNATKNKKRDEPASLEKEDKVSPFCTPLVRFKALDDDTSPVTSWI